jgi:mono/diheme cytochrome c family protein
LAARVATRAAVVAALAAGQTAVIDEALTQSTVNEATSIWDGVFTDAQAERGRTAYTGPCDRCHGSNLDGAAVDPDMLPAPPVAGPKFLRKWDGRSLAALFDYTRATMPTNNPGFLTNQELVDIIAYMLAVSAAPPGDDELRGDPQTLAQIVVSPPK